MGLDLGYYSDKKLLKAYKERTKSANLMVWITIAFTFSAIWIGYIFCNLIAPLSITGILLWLFAFLSVGVESDYEKEIQKRNLEIE